MIASVEPLRGGSDEPGARAQTLRLRPIDLDLDGPLVVAFARELFAISFGRSRFAEQFGSDGSRYIPWLAEKQRASPGNAALALIGEEPAGMVVTGCWPDDPAVGYVYHYYLVPRQRGRGLAAQLDAYATDRLVRRGYPEVRLSVAERNQPALRFYEKQGWVPAGPRPDQPGILYMRKLLSA